MSDLFVDSSAFIALYNNTDVLHDKAIFHSQKIAQKNANLLTSTNVLMETATVLSMRISHQRALEFLRDVRNGSIEIIHPTVDLIVDAEEIFISQSSKNVSYSDCICFAIMRERGTKNAFSFDKDFERNGFELVQ